jgi:hypothetical protein
MSESIEYPKDDFTAQYRLKSETGGFAGNTPRPFTQLKYTFPGFRDGEGPVTYDLKTALVLESAGIRNDLSALVHRLTLKGLGLSESDQRSPERSAVKESAEFVFGQIGLGSAQGAALSLANRFYFHIENSIRHRIDITRRGTNFGTMNIDTRVLSDPAHLPNNGFNTEGMDLPENASGIVLSRIRARFGREQIQEILENSTNVAWRYDATPRLILRANHPHSLYDNWGDPRMQLHTQFSSSQQAEVSKQSLEIPLDPVHQELGH